MAAMVKVPRHEFVPFPDRSMAYINRPLAIGHGQTISQPYIVAVMTDLLDLKPDDRVLEIGTGCGYQAAVLAEVAGRVYTVEIVKDLAEKAQQRLRDLGYENIETRIGNGYEGWPKAAPFDAVIITSAPPHIPSALVDQLKPGGRMVVPVGSRNETQMLYRCVKREDGTLDKERKLPVAFVPMVDKR
jgi:protein-L-isoaspartate(D-aspartate) O-methyltransferase